MVIMLVPKNEFTTLSDISSYFIGECQEVPYINLKKCSSLINRLKFKVEKEAPFGQVNCMIKVFSLLVLLLIFVFLFLFDNVFFFYATKYISYVGKYIL